MKFLNEIWGGNKLKETGIFSISDKICSLLNMYPKYYIIIHQKNYGNTAICTTSVVRALVISPCTWMTPSKEIIYLSTENWVWRIEKKKRRNHWRRATQSISMSVRETPLKIQRFKPSRSQMPNLSHVSISSNKSYIEDELYSNQVPQTVAYIVTTTLASLHQLKQFKLPKIYDKKTKGWTLYSPKMSSYMSS